MLRHFNHICNNLCKFKPKMFQEFVEHLLSEFRKFKHAYPRKCPVLALSLNIFRPKAVLVIYTRPIKNALKIILPFNFLWTNDDWSGMCFTLNRLVNYRHLQQIQSYSFFPDSVAKQSMVSPSTLWEDKCANSMMGNWKWTLCRLVVPMCCPSWKKGRPHEHYPLLYTRPVRRLPRKIYEVVCPCNQVAYSGDHDIDFAFNNSKWVMVVALSLHSKISSDVLRLV